MVNGFFFKVGALNQVLTGEAKYAFCCIATDTFEHIDNPRVYFISKFIEVDIIFFDVTHIAYYFYEISGEHCSEFDIISVFTYSQRNLFRADKYVCMLLFGIELNANDFSRAKGSSDIQADIISIVNDVDIFVAQFAYNTMYTRAFNTHTSSNGVDAVVKRFYGNFSSFARDACNALDGNKAIVNFRHFEFEKAL